MELFYLFIQQIVLSTYDIPHTIRGTHLGYVSDRTATGPCPHECSLLS